MDENYVTLDQLNAILADYAKTADVASTYLTQSKATSTYETQTHAEATYLPKENLKEYIRYDEVHPWSEQADHGFDNDTVNQ